VPPKAITFPTDAKLLYRARERLVRLAQKHGLALRQSYVRVGKFTLIRHQRYPHAKQFKRANRVLRALRTYLARVIRDIGRKIGDDTGLKKPMPSRCLWRARCANRNPVSAGARSTGCMPPEVEYIGKGRRWPMSLALGLAGFCNS
jgi:transposase, IS5 family